jgi:hypothetical protein
VCLGSSSLRAEVPVQTAPARMGLDCQQLLGPQVDKVVNYLRQHRYCSLTASITLPLSNKNVYTHHHRYWQRASEYGTGPIGRWVATNPAMTVFAGLVGIAGAVAALRGTHGRRVSPYKLLLMTAGTHKLARLVSKDAITSPLRMPFTRYRESGGPAEVMEDVRQQGQLRHAVGELVSCPFCLAVWIATGFSVGFLFAPRFTRIVTSALMAIAGSDYLQLIYAYLQQAATED